jgi:dienelactone hydrolase
MILAVLMGSSVLAKETLSPLEGDLVPQTYSELWSDFDPRAEPLDVEVLKEWEEDGVVLMVLRYRVGIFKGEKAMIAAVYGYPKGGSKLPGLVQIHGGGQYADYRAPLNNAKRGYATISISWAGRINAPDYKVSPAEVKLFWEGKTDDPNYRVTTDWGVLDGYHAPTRSGANGYGRTAPSAWTIDPVESARNNPWFLSTMAARRALTFLEQQPEVDKTKLGVYGHSMGGKLTVLTAGADSRVKAAVPSCGGVSGRSDGLNADDIALKNITAPILFQSPANDFHGRINDLQTAFTEIKSDEWRATCAPHHNHQDTVEYEVASQLWFDQQLKGTFAFPKTPILSVNLKTENPSASIRVDDSMPVLAVDMFYTRQGQIDGQEDDRENTKARFWHHATARQDGSTWTAHLPLSNTDQPLWVYANVTYKLTKPVSVAGYYYRIRESDTFIVSSRLFMATPEELMAAGVKPRLEPSLTIEDFTGDWQKEWFSYKPEDGWGRKTHKVYDAMWKAPSGAKLALEVKSDKENVLVVGIDAFAAEVRLKGGAWQSVSLAPDDFKNAAGEPLASWAGIRELRLDASDSLKIKVDGENKTLKLGGVWTGSNPEFRNLRWIEAN